MHDSSSAVAPVSKTREVRVLSGDNLAMVLSPLTYNALNLCWLHLMVVTQKTRFQVERIPFIPKGPIVYDQADIV